MAAGRLLAAKFSEADNLKTILMGSALLGACVSGLVPMIESLFGFYLLLALSGIAAAPLWPTILAEARECLKEDATLLFVLLACAGIAGFGFTPWAMGMIGDALDLRASFFVIPGYFVVLVLLFAWIRRSGRSSLPMGSGSIRG
jgi:fucose permease